MKMSLRSWATGLGQLALAAWLGVTLAGCQTATEPFTGRSQFILTSAGEETRLGLQGWTQTLQKEKPGTNAAHKAAVERVGKAVAAAANQPDYKWEFKLFESTQANAFCLPGGKVGVYEGLFKYVANDAELAAVMGHEVGHAIARHGGERMTEGMMVNVGAAGLAIALGSKDAQTRDRWLMAYTGISTVGYVLPFSRKHEYAADEIGLVLMAKAGYDPHAAVAFWQKFAAGTGGSGTPEFLSTHPVGANRIQQLQTLMPKATVQYEMAPKRLGTGEVFSATPAKK